MKFLGLFLVSLPTLTLGAPSAIAGRQQPERPFFTQSVTTEGPRCRPGTYSLDLGQDGRTQAIHFDNWRVLLDADQPATDLDRDSYCDITFRVKYPIGCTTVTLANGIRGFNKIQPGSGMKMVVTRSYAGPGLDRNTLPEEVSDGSSFRDGQDQFTKPGNVTASVRVVSENQSVVEYKIHTRAFIVDPLKKGDAEWSLEDISVNLINPATTACTW